MSIDAGIKRRIREHVRRGRLFHLPPLIAGMPTVRTMFVSKEVNNDVYPPWAENWDGYRLAMFRGTLDAFTQGDCIAVAEDPFKKPSSAFMARIDPVSDDLWDIRSIDPRPGIRCFGGFVGKDAFVALTWNYRENVSDREDWRCEVDGCRTGWRQLFDPYPPFHGANLDEYLSNFIAV